MLTQEQLSLVKNKITSDKIGIAAAIHCVIPNSIVTPQELVEIQRVLFSTYQDLRKVIAQIHLDDKILALSKRSKWIKDRGGDATDVEQEMLKIAKQKENLANS
jgi:hypothetical protein